MNTNSRQVLTSNLSLATSFCDVYWYESTKDSSLWPPVSDLAHA